MDQTSARQLIATLKPIAGRLARPLTIAITMLAICLTVVALTPQAMSWTSGHPPSDFDPYTVNKPRALLFVDAQGAVLGRRGAKVGERLSLSLMPPYLPAAFLAMEDRRFYNHHGVDFIGLLHAAYKDWRARKYVAGGSSITQQTVKILFDRREKTLARKWTEIRNAAWLEHNYSKNQILALYLNRIYLGDGSYGVDAAARDYFGVSARALSLPQAAMLAAITRAPALYGPRHDLARAQARAAIVLRAMSEQGFITQTVAQEAMRHPATLTSDDREMPGNYVLDAAMAEAKGILEERTAPDGELIVHTTVQGPAQALSETVARDAIAAYGAKKHVGQAAILVMTPQGAINAMVGGLDYTKSVFNRATQAHRQPGSAFKPFVYLAALQSGRSPWEWREDKPVDIAGYHPTNYKQAHYGDIRLIDALAHSVNTVTVNLAQEVGLGNVIAAARQTGITAPLGNNASLPLGTNEVTPLELTAAYAYFANGGEKVSPYLVSGIDSALTGEAVYRHPLGNNSANPGSAVTRDMVAMLYDVVVSGTGTAARLSDREAAGKTGTTQDYRDAW
ncbi:MAG: transglycosylase domain-containing protein, partial [Alphaproteobacteria bacterium]|nr:transglycosylase domain-containing protein [Alphaproteobacteria bacterium]